MPAKEIEGKRRRRLLQKAKRKKSGGVHSDKTGNSHRYCLYGATDGRREYSIQPIKEEKGKSRGHKGLKRRDYHLGLTKSRYGCQNPRAKEGREGEGKRVKTEKNSEKGGTATGGPESGTGEREKSCRVPIRDEAFSAFKRARPLSKEVR